MVAARGGTGIHVRVDHTVRGEVQELFERIRQEKEGASRSPGQRHDGR